jgi:hypothetical protein
MSQKPFVASFCLTVWLDTCDNRREKVLSSREKEVISKRVKIISKRVKKGLQKEAYKKR